MESSFLRAEILLPPPFQNETKLLQQQKPIFGGGGKPVTKGEIHIKFVKFLPYFRYKCANFVPFYAFLGTTSILCT